MESARLLLLTVPAHSRTNNAEAQRPWHLMTAGIELRIGQRVLLARQAREWTQSQLAEASGVIQSTISRVEGGRVPTIAVLIQLAKALDVRPGWLLDGTAAGSEGLVAERIAKAEPMYGMAAARAALAVLDVLQRG